MGLTMGFDSKFTAGQQFSFALGEGPVEVGVGALKTPAIKIQLLLIATFIILFNLAYASLKWDHERRRLAKAYSTLMTVLLFVLMANKCLATGAGALATAVTGAAHAAWTRVRNLRGIAAVGAP